MTIFNIEITEQSHLDGITAARDAYNQSLPETVLNEVGEEISNPEIILTNAEYVQFVMSRAAESYAKQYNT